MVRPPVHWSCSVMEHRRAQPGMAVLEEGGVKPPLYEEGASFVAPLGGVDVVEVEGLFGEGGRIIGAGVFPGGDVGEIGVVAEGFAFWGLVFLAEMAAAGFAAIERVQTHKFAEFEEIGDASDLGEIGVVAEGFAFWGLVFLAEMAAAGFAAIERVQTHKFAEFEEIGDASGF